MPHRTDAQLSLWLRYKRYRTEAARLRARRQLVESLIPAIRAALEQRRELIPQQYTIDDLVNETVVSRIIPMLINRKPASTLLHFARAQTIYTLKQARRIAGKPGMQLGYGDDPEPAANLPPDGSAGRREFLSAIRAALDEREFLLIRLHYFEGMELRDVAMDMRVSERTACSIHRKAMDKLREVL